MGNMDLDMKKSELDESDAEKKEPELGLDDIYISTLSKFIGWFSPASFNLAFFDWYAHLCISPDKQFEILQSASKKYQSFLIYCIDSYFNPECKKVTSGEPEDSRFKDNLWKKIPYNIFSQNFLLWESLWNEATQNVEGTNKHRENVMNFLAQHWLDILSPSNYPFTNPEVIKATIEEGGINFYNGFQNYIEDCIRILEKKPPKGAEKFQVGVNLAVTKGKVIYRNKLIELIQYEPKTKKVFKEPILFIPAWIMKYYILDLSQENSMVKYLVEQGHTVFMISWINPDGSYRDFGLDEYINLGVLSSLDIISKICPESKINTVGYCIGATLLMMTAAYMAKIDDNRINTITLFAGEIDFKDAGELLIFIDESQINYLEHIMWEKGYLDGSQMIGTFSMLHPVKLIWSRIICEYLLGKRESIFDLMAWDFDTTRLPYKMHSEYLTKCFLNNDLVQGKFSVNGKKIMLPDISVPIFAVSTVTDHVSPWKSVYKIHLFTKTDLTFVLTSGGHNAGIISEPGHKGRTYRIKTTAKGDKRVSAKKWEQETPEVKGSWWPEFHKWLEEHSSGKVGPPEIGNPKVGIKIICDAPGTYVLQR